MRGASRVARLGAARLASPFRGGPFGAGLSDLEAFKNWKGAQCVNRFATFQPGRATFEQLRATFEQLRATLEQFRNLGTGTQPLNRFATFDRFCWRVLGKSDLRPGGVHVIFFGPAWVRWVRSG